MINTLRARRQPLERRGPWAQRERREAERAHKLSVLELVAWLREKARYTIGEIAQLIGLCRRTICGWQARRRTDDLEARPRGRPTRRASVAARNEVIGFLRENGPQVGLPTLLAEFPALARRELKDVQRRYRRVCRRKRTVYAESLTWREAGAAWATDFTKLPCVLDGAYTHGLLVRDLQSKKILASLPAGDENAITACGLLAALFARHGAPLVLKSDNGSAFIAEAAGDLLAQHHVVHLKSPPRTPAYNGSAEAGMGWIKTRAHYQAARHGRPGAWSSDDLEAARRQGNELGRPWGAKGPTPNEAWDARQPINVLQRAAFRGQVRRQLDAAPDDLSRAERAKLKRQIIRRALVEHGLLSIERGWIPLRKKR